MAIVHADEPEMPAVAEDFAHITPEYRTLPGWQRVLDRRGCAMRIKLPVQAAVDYLKFISDFSSKWRLGADDLYWSRARRDVIVPRGDWQLASWLCRSWTITDL